jgi:hypothetical protein
MVCWHGNSALLNGIAGHGAAYNGSAEQPANIFHHIAKISLKAFEQAILAGRKA